MNNYECAECQMFHQPFCRSAKGLSLDWHYFWHLCTRTCVIMQMFVCVRQTASCSHLMGPVFIFSFVPLDFALWCPPS